MTALTDLQAAVAPAPESPLPDQPLDGANESPALFRVRVPERIFDWSEQLPTLRVAREAFEKVYLEELLRRARGNVTAAARVAGRNRTDLYDLLRRSQVDPTRFR